MIHRYAAEAGSREMYPRHLHCNLYWIYSIHTSIQSYTYMVLNKIWYISCISYTNACLKPICLVRDNT